MDNRGADRGLERFARASYAEALAEAGAVGVEPPEWLVRYATESLTLLDADAFADELDKDDEVAALGSTADRIRDYLRFERFGPVEARRRRRLAERLRDRALQARGEHGGLSRCPRPRGRQHEAAAETRDSQRASKRTAETLWSLLAGSQPRPRTS